MERKKIVVLATAGLAFALMICMGVYHALCWPDPIELNTEGFPSLGDKSAKVEIVLFEDFHCAHCREFTKEIFPEIENEYIKTGKARYVIVLLAFMDGSKPLANGAMAVFESTPERFFPFVNAIFRKMGEEPVVESDLFGIAEEVGGIDLNYLKSCIRNHCYYAQLDSALQWAKNVMGKNFGTPALYVNGVRVSTTSFYDVQAAVLEFGNRRSNE
ncbi:MAG: hypothetical protein A3E80_02255 [Chlamydiae bacterium RIFCSPHIGHO2_12_FULL_49_9]|nr:MAG: hypothetical protein A3E80_02255 [Chlamydiae bacterium RIFCSPHIGHO2_12_FULL_49_9]